MIRTEGGSSRPEACSADPARDNASSMDHPDEPSASDRVSDAPDRSSYPVRVTRLEDREDDTYLRSLSPADRIAMVWPLTLQAWAFKEGLDDEPRLQRHVVRVVRGRG